MKQKLLEIIKNNGYCTETYTCRGCTLKVCKVVWRNNYRFIGAEIWIDYKRRKARAYFIEKFGYDKLVEELL